MQRIKSLGLAFTLLSTIGVSQAANVFYMAPNTLSGGVSEQGVDLASGKLVRTETDISTPALSFSRLYVSQGAVDSGLGGWKHNYSRTLDSIKIAYSEYNGLKTNQYSNASQACLSGWNNIKNTAYTGLLASAQVSYNGGICTLKKNGVVMARLPVRKSNGHLGSQIHILNRPDGSSYTFYLQGGIWKTTTNQDIKLVQNGINWVVTLLDDTKET